MAIVSTYPVSLTYKYGVNVGTPNSSYTTNDGVTFAFNPLLSGAKDVTLNQSTVSVLTNNFALSDCLSSEPYLSNLQYTTQSVLSIGSYYLSASTAVNSKIQFITDSTKATLFTLNFNTVLNTVSFSYSNLFVTWVDGDSYIRMAAPVNDNSQYFTYNLYKNNISLFVDAPGDSRDGYVLCNVDSTYLEVAVFAGFNNTINVFTINRLSEPSYKSLGNSSNIKYVSAPNSINVAATTSALKYNYLLTAPYTNVDPTTNELGYNITPLKNYYSPQHIQTPVLSAQSRSYNKIFTGLNTEDGYEKIYLSYLGNEVAQTFYKDTDTYFHYPVSAVNIALSASTLAAAGAYASSSPWRSDRLFVKRADYRKYTPWGNVNGSPQNGVLFCSWLWLSSGAGTATTPVWVDRYFDPTKISTTAVLNTNGAGPSNNNYPDVVWDTISTQVLSGESLYVYHRIGNNDNQLVVDTLSSNLTHYIQEWANPLVNAATGLSAGYVNNFSASASVTTYQNTREPALNTGTSFAVMSMDNNDFYSPGITLAFQAYNNDWAAIRGDQIVGNYYNGGIGFFKYNPLLTPFVTILGNNLQTYNTNIVSLANTSTAPASGNNFALKSSYDESYFIVDVYFNVYEYDQDGVKLNQYNLNDGGATVSGVLLGAHLVNFSSVRRIMVFTKIGTAVHWYMFDTINNALLLYQGSQAGVNNYALDIECNPYFYTGTGNSTVDNNDIIFHLQNDVLVKGLNTSSPQYILSAYKAEYIACDHENNIWLLYADNNLCKLDNYGRLLWDISLTNSQAFTDDKGNLRNSKRIINFTAELDSNSNKMLYYGLVIDGRTQSVIKVEPLSGGIVINNQLTPATYYSLSSSPLNIQPAGDCTGYDYQRKYVYDAENTPNIVRVKAFIKNISTLEALDVITLDYDVSNLTPGWHHFAVTITPGDEMRMYVDGSYVNRAQLVTPQFGIYRVYNNRNNSDLVIGTSSFKSQTLYQYTNQNVDPYSFNGSIADVRFYDTALYISDIKAIQKRFFTNSFSDLTWSAPAGQRYYIEQVERFFPHRLPGAKSHKFNIKIKNSNIIDPGIRSIIEQNIIAALSKTTPVYTELNKIIWQ